MTQLRTGHLLVFVVAYNAERYVNSVLDRIPQEIWDSSLAPTDILFIDDCSVDDTFEIVRSYVEQTGRMIEVRRNTINQGYGGNQKLGYQYAIDNGYEAVVLLHGDGQYDPALIPLLATPVLDGTADVVIGSRMMDRKAARNGGMPMYKFVGNIVLTAIQNFILGVQLSEFHSGYRVYSTAALRAVPFQYNANYFDFDTDILIQMIDNRQRFLEISIPTFYGDEISHVNGMLYAAKILLATLFSRLQKQGIVHFRKFDYKRHRR
ncbi:MAG: glycosyltransferase family 2 protein [Alphaproteobacteria bacterium]